MLENTDTIIKIMLVDDHPIVRQGIRTVVENNKNYEVISEASSANEAIDKINKRKPDIVIVDIMLAGNINGIELVRSLHSRFPEIRSLILSMYDETLYAERALRAGARGYLMKEIAPQNIIEAIQTVMSGELFLRNDISKQIIDRLICASSNPEGMSFENLSDREFEIFQLLGNGFSVKEIAKKLNISIFTVESHKKNIRDKFKFESTAELLKHAIQWVIAQGRKG